MHDKIMHGFFGLVIIFMLGLFSYISLDVWYGQRCLVLAGVNVKTYEPPHTTFRTDSDGRLVSEYHPARYILSCSSEVGKMTFDVTADIYVQIKEGDMISVRYIRGGLSHGRYFHTVVYINPEEELR